MPGIPPPNHNGPNRRQNDYQYPYPPQTHPAYYHPHQYYPQQQPLGHHHPQQWYPQQPYSPQPYSPQPYPPVQRQYHQYQHMPMQQPHVPLVVSSQPQHFHPYNQPVMSRTHMPTPPIAHAHLPMHQAPSTPSMHPLPHQSPALSMRSEVIATPPPASTTSRPSTAAGAPTQSVGIDATEAKAVDEATVAISEAAKPSSAMSKLPITLPWLSVPESPFPPAARRKRRKQAKVPTSTPGLKLPNRGLQNEQDTTSGAEESLEAGEITEEQTESQASTVAAPSEQETPATSQAPSEVDDLPVTPSSATQPVPASAQARTPTRPVVPALPKTPHQPAPKSPTLAPQESLVSGKNEGEEATQNIDHPKSSEATEGKADDEVTLSSEPAPAPKLPPKSWADLVRSKNAAAAAAASPAANGAVTGERPGASKTGGLAEAIRSFTVDSLTKVAFIKPRGLVNTGNMCYMNSVLQTLAFCTPFYDFIDLVGRKAAHSFKSDTPLLDAMILFLREYPVIDSASSVEQLRMRLKSEELEQFGDAFAPENVYDATKRLPRFASMRRGHQQDAEEFLIFFLEALHDECLRVINSLPISAIENVDPVSPISDRSSTAEAGWQEVGPKQKASVTHTSGHSHSDTPITKIFGGTLRSELRVPGKKNSVTFQPYQPLQLDIGASDVHNIIDALKGLTRSETIHGDFNSPRGPNVAATKQIFIETLPPVLILHLKRFEYNNTGGTQKIWKKVGYPLELTIPKEVFPQQKRGQLSISGLPRYRLESVIYHHGKNASSGHYTVDTRRQDGKEWIRVDDTIIRRLRAEDVAEGGAEEDPKVLAKALEQHKKDSSSKNLFDQFGAVDDEDTQSEGGWNTAGPKESGGKKWSAVANGTATPSSAGAKTPRKDNVKDNKVAYILFYRRI